MRLSWGVEVKPLWSKNTSEEVPLPWNKTTFRVKKQQQQQQHFSINLNFLKFKHNAITFRYGSCFFNWLIICSYSHSHSLSQAFRDEMVGSHLKGTWGKTGKMRREWGESEGRFPGSQTYISKRTKPFFMLTFSFREGSKSLIISLFYRATSVRPSSCQNLLVLLLTASLTFFVLNFSLALYYLNAWNQAVIAHINRRQGPKNNW